MIYSFVLCRKVSIYFFFFAIYRGFFIISKLLDYDRNEIYQEVKGISSIIMNKGYALNESACFSCMYRTLKVEGNGELPFCHLPVNFLKLLAPRLQPALVTFWGACLTYISSV